MENTIYLGTSMGLLKSIDDGDEYNTLSLSSKLNSPITEIIRDVPSNTAFLMSYNGIATINLSTDNITNITDVFFAEEIIFYNMAKSAFNSALYVATNAGLLKTIDFGDTWQYVVLPDGTDKHIYAVSVVDDQILYISNSSNIYRSGDGGYNWSTLTNFGDNTVKRLLCLYDGFILAATETEVWVTRNNGTSWNQVNSSNSMGYIYNLVYDSNTGRIYILSSNGIFIMQNSFAITASQNYVIETFNAAVESGSSEMLFGTKNAVLYNYFGANDDFFGFKSQFGKNRTPIVYVNNASVLVNYYWYFIDGYKVVFKQPKSANDIIKIADSYQVFTPINGVWDRDNITFNTTTYDQVNYKVDGDLDRYSQIFVFSSNSSDPIDSATYTIDYNTNTITFLSSVSSGSSGGFSSSEFINAQNFSQKQIADETGGEVYSNTEATINDVAVTSVENTIFNVTQDSNEEIYMVAASPTRSADEIITVSLTRIDVYKNDQLVSPATYSRDYSMGLITFNTQQDATDIFAISVYGTSIINIGIRTHSEIDNALSQLETGLTNNMSDVFLNNLAHFTLALKHAIPYDSEGNKLEAYMKNVYYHSFGVDPNSDYDVFHSTLDKNISVEQNILPETFKSVYSVLRLNFYPRDFLIGTNNGIWRAKDRAIIYNCLTENQDVELVLALNESLLTMLHAGSNDGLYQSIDFGETWQAASCNINYDLPDVVYDIFTAINGKIYMGTNDGIFMNYGRNLTPDVDQDDADSSPWIQVGLSGKKVYGISEDENQEVILAAEDGLYRYYEGLWVLIGLSGIQCRVVFYDYLRDVLYVGIKDGLYYSLDNGSNFIAVNNVTDTIISIAKDYFGAVWLGGINTLYRVSPAVALSQVAFQIVSSINDSIFPIYAIDKDSVTQGHVVVGSKRGLLFISDPKINKILMKNNYLFVATSEGIFRITLDGSRDWVEVTSDLTTAIYYDIITATETNNLIACADYGIIISDDNGTLWIQYFASPEAITQLVEVNTGPDEGIYALSASKIYKSIDNGYNWTEYLSIADFPSLAEFTYFFAVLQYM